MSQAHFSTRDIGALGGLSEQLKSRGDPDLELFHLRITKLAYFKAQVRGCPAGPELIDWLQAEAELRPGAPDRPEHRETDLD